jgi:hypothetical protein
VLLVSNGVHDEERVGPKLASVSIKLSDTLIRKTGYYVNVFIFRIVWNKEMV